MTTYLSGSNRFPFVLSLCFLAGLGVAQVCLSPLQAAEQSSEVSTATKAPSISLLEVYQDSLANDSLLRKAEQDLRASLEMQPQARSLLLPNVSGSLGYAWVNQDQSGAGATDVEQYGPNVAISLNQPLYNRGAFSLNRQAKALIEAAQQQYVAAKQSLGIRVAQAYFDVLAAGDNLEFALSEQTAIARQLEQSQTRYEYGQIASTDVYEAQAMYDATLAQVISARNTLRSRREALAKITGISYEKLSKLDHNHVFTALEPQSESYWTELALNQSPTIQALVSSLEASREAVEYERSSRYPKVGLTASHSYESTDGKMQGSSADRTTNATRLAVTMTVPLYTGGGIDSKIREAQYKFQSTQETFEGTRRTLINQVRDAYWGVFAMLSRIDALAQALKSATAALESTEAGYEVGTRTIVDVLTAQTFKHRSERDLKHARYDYVMNLIQLKAAVGEMCEGDIETVNEWLTTAETAE